MINQQLIDYIKQQLALNVNKEQIKGSLLGNGWDASDVEEGFNAIVPQPVNAPTPTPPSSINRQPIASFINPTISPIQQGVVDRANTQKPKHWIKFVLIFVLIIILAGAIWYAFKYFNKINNTVVVPVENQETNQVVAEMPPAEVVVVPNVEEVANLWSIFDKQREALKNNDMATYNTVSYEPITSTKEFNQYSSFLYNATSKLNEIDFINKWQDEKQAIYSTVANKTPDGYTYNQENIMFVKKDGSWKILLQSSPSWGVSKTGTGQTVAQAEQTLQKMMLDSDQDGLTDTKEVCGGSEQSNSKCVKTDPNKRDTNGNGWWDGIEAEMK